MKTNFSTQTVEGPVSFNFADMALMTDVFETAALEAAENNDTEKSMQLCEIAEKLGFAIDIEVPGFSPGQAGQDSETTG